MIQAAVNYVSTLNPAFPDSIEGASLQEIRDLEKICGRNIPPCYREFLLAMGKDTGGLEFLPEGKTDLGSVAQFYREEVPTGEVKLPQDALVMAVEGEVVPMLWLMPSASGNPEVFSATYVGQLEIYAASLSNLICQTAFYKHRIAAFPYRVTLYRSGKFPSIMETGSAIAAQSGYAALPFSDAANGCFDSNIASVNISDMAHLRRHVTIGFKEESDVGTLIEKYVQELQFKVLRH